MQEIYCASGLLHVGTQCSGQACMESLAYSGTGHDAL